MKKKHVWWIAISGALVVGAALWGPIVSRVEQPKYEIVSSTGSIEIRQYAPIIVAETEVTGEREKAINQGFRAIAEYIFGNNLSSQKVSMTAPVTQQASEKIAMTAPVTQQGEGHRWQVRFVMPATYTMETLPKPKNTAIHLRQIDAKRFAVIRFSGTSRDDNLKSHAGELAAFIRASNLSPRSAPIYAFYNPPWTLPFLRRNEVMIEVAPATN